MTLFGWLYAAWLWWSEAEKWQLGIVGVLVMVATCLLVYWHCQRVWIRSAGQWEKKIADLKETLTRIKAQNLGVELDVSSLEFFHSKQGLDGVMVAAVVERLVNRNLTDAAIQIEMRAPLLLPSGGSTIFRIAATPESTPVSYVCANVPFLPSPSLMNIQSKRAIGPGYLLFNFRRRESPEPFPAFWNDITDLEFAKLIRNSEMYFEVSDVANGTMVRVLAPGTEDKRRTRVATEKNKPSD